MRVACIGSRDLNSAAISTCEKLGAWVVECGHELHTGNALGADQAFARGANRVNPALVHLHLPWKTYEAEAIHPQNRVRSVEDLNPEDRIVFATLAQQYHPVYQRLSQGAQKLMMRNGMIILGCQLVLAWPSKKPGGGGTGQGMRLAKAHTIKLVDLNHLSQDDLFGLCEEIKES